MAAKGTSFGRSSTGVSPRPMLMGAAHNALWAFNARVSLTLPVCHRPQAATLLCGLALFARPLQWSRPADLKRGHGAPAVWLGTNRNVSVCLILRRWPPNGLSLSRCCLRPRKRGNRERVSCFRFQTGLVNSC